MKIDVGDSSACRASPVRCQIGSKIGRHGSAALFSTIALVAILSGGCCELFPDLCGECALPSAGNRSVVAPSADETADAFRMAVIGDSLAWGNGLATGDKAWWLVAQAISDQTRRPVNVQVCAFTQAEIVHIVGGEGEVRPLGKKVTGEVPSPETSIMDQVHEIIDPMAQDLVLVTGCINDVGVSNIVTPMTTMEERQQFEEEIRTACHDDMKLLLEELIETTPNARIILAGYYPILGEASFASTDSALLNDFLFLNGVNVAGNVFDFEQGLVDRSELFHSLSNENQELAVEEVNQAQVGNSPVISWVTPDFQPEHVIFSGVASRLFDLTAESGNPALDAFANAIGVGFFAEDDFRECRFGKCQEAGSTLSLEQQVGCIWGSVAHPNIAGANAYSDAIFAAWESANESE